MISSAGGRVQTHQHAQVHGQVDLPPAAVIGRRPQTRHNALSFPNVASGVVGVHVLHPWAVMPGNR